MWYGMVRCMYYIIMVAMMMEINCNALFWLFIDIAVKRSIITVLDTYGHECMYECMYVYILYMYVCVCVYVYVCFHVCMYVCTDVCMPLCMYVYIVCM